MQIKKRSLPTGIGHQVVVHIDLEVQIVGHKFMHCMIRTINYERTKQARVLQNILDEQEIYHIQRTVMFTLLVREIRESHS